MKMDKAESGDSDSSESETGGTQLTDVPIAGKKSYEGDIEAFLKNKTLISNIMNVKITNNQKGRIRQNFIRDFGSFDEKGRQNSQLIFSKIQAILKQHPTDEISETGLRKLKVLNNFLSASMKEVKTEIKVIKEESSRHEKKKDKPKRYIVFVGNLPTNVIPDEISNHLKDIPGVLSVRIKKETKKEESNENKNKKESTRIFAHVELKDEFSYKLALAKHHTMLRNKRINILYSRDKNKVDIKTLKKKSSKVNFLSKSSVLSANKKRNIRRREQKQAANP